MCAVGLIVEYNPFHNGHLYHLQQSKLNTAQDHVVAVMSGHFLQRGEPALLDKWTRTKLALEGGCDLVLELPVVYATSSAEWFAYGAVATLEATGIVRHLSFGTESGELEPLLQAASLLANEPLYFSIALGDLLKQGLAYPVAFSRAITQIFPQLEQFRFDLPNHTLGLHYLIALNRLQSDIVPHTIAREQAQYSDTTLANQSIASATAIRQALLKEKDVKQIAPYVPLTTYSELHLQLPEDFMSWEPFMQHLTYQLLVHSTSELQLYREVTEGLEHRIKAVLPTLSSLSFEELIATLKTKRYTRTKLQRAMLSILLQHKKEVMQRQQLKDGISYIRVLGFNKKGQALLKQMKSTAKVPVIHTPSQLKPTPPFLQLDIAATSLYRLGQGKLGKMWLDDYQQPPIKL